MTEIPIIPEKTGMQSKWALNRRTALKLLGTGSALALASCGKPQEEIVPYVEMPERLVPGEPLKFATTLPLSGYGRGVLAIAVDGRPIKIEGNPRHPASLGATDVFAEAAIMSLYDPDRSKAPRHGDDISTWDAFAGALHTQMDQEKAREGAGLCIVSGCVTSPTLLRQIDDLLKQFPKARWYAYEPISDDAALAGSAMVYGQRLTQIPRISDAAVMLAIDDDPLGPGPRQIANARGFSQRRQRISNPFLRLYVVEPEWSLTGANCDYRLALHPRQIRNFAFAIAAALQGENAPELPHETAHFAQAVAADLKAHRGRALITVGRRQPAELHALGFWLNAQLNAPADMIMPVDGNRLSDAQALQALAHDLDSGQIKTLIIIDANPVYDGPADLNLVNNIGKVESVFHLGLHDNETAQHVHWHLPLSHTLETWSDLRAFDGTASIVQPLILPLYDTRSAHDVIGFMSGTVAPSAYDLVRQTWMAQAFGKEFESWWKQTLHDGFVANSAFKPISTGTPKRPEITPATTGNGLTLLLSPDPSVWDGRFANNSWLQECPHPFTKDVWGNCVRLSLADAQHHRIADGDIVEINHDGKILRGAARVQHGQADGVIAIALGYGRTHAGALGNGVGSDAYKLRTLEMPWMIENVVLKTTDERRNIPTMQHQFVLEGEAKDLYPVLTLSELAKGKRPPNHQNENQPSLYPSFTNDTYAWAMVVDTSLCIGCNACVLACQAENNVPVIGPEEVVAGRDMHWLRVDRYVIDPEKPPGFQPVPCMHCENAPCEPVCPVAASVHDGEGLNVQVYNRCIGTRFCQSNCPYKVRRFNWFGYASGQEFANLGEIVTKAANNPNVTVRARGVMEKCTYCVQRISRARRRAEKIDQSIADGDVVTACQAACPTQAISFGDKNNKTSSVNAQRAEPHHYALLGQLGTRPRTTYLARLRNPNPAMGQETQT
jgi:Fe-S-cluster-containing dehydrogenase component/anaerobic selenocysteine-containing dehydrogenase